MNGKANSVADGVVTIGAHAQSISPLQFDVIFKVINFERSAKKKL